MTTYSRVHLKNDVLLRNLASHLSQDRTNTATVLADLGEVDFRKLFVPASYPSMFMYCVYEHHMSEDMAYKRIQAARAARRFPALFPALAEGRLHLTAVVLLAPYLNPATADELIAAATHKTKAQIELLLAERFPKPDLPTLVRAIAPPASEALAARPVDPSIAQNTPTCMELVPEPVVPSTGANAVACTVPLATPRAMRPRLTPRSPARFALQLTMGQVTHDLLREAQELLGHVIPSGDVEAVLQRALGEMGGTHRRWVRLKQQKFADCVHARPMRGSTDSRNIPAEVQRAVWKRDGGQCTFVSDSGRRCEARTRVEFDHVDPVARGGESTVDNLRLLCRVHNHDEAELVYGHELMAGKREQGVGSGPHG